MFAYLMAWLNTYMSDEEGQGMAEYGLLLALIAVGVIAALVILGPQISGIFTRISTDMQGAGF